MSKEEDIATPKSITSESDTLERKETVVVDIPRINPRTLPGLANGQNKGAIHWSDSNLAIVFPIFLRHYYVLMFDFF